MRIALPALAMAGFWILLPRAASAAADFSAPRKTMITLQQAIQAHDANTLRSCFDTTGPNSKAAQTYVDAWEASLRFQEAMEKKFGFSGTEAIKAVRISPSSIDSKTNWEETGTLTTNGDAALLTIEPPSSDASAKTALIRFKQIRGEWKIDAGAMFTADDPKTTTQLRQMAQITAAIKDVTDDITSTSGKIFSAQQAQQALVQKVIPIVNPPIAATAPATQHSAATH